jgi:hypothetical protein
MRTSLCKSRKVSGEGRGIFARFLAPLGMTAKLFVMSSEPASPARTGDDTHPHAFTPLLTRRYDARVTPVVPNRTKNHSGITVFR